MYKDSISFAGAGRVASALCRELFRIGIRIDLVVSETESGGRPLAESCNAEWSSRLHFPYSSKVIIVAVPDHRLKDVLNRIQCGSDTLVAHTAGSFGLDAFPGHIINKGVFYPLQTFSKNRKVSFAGLPFLLESSGDQYSEILRQLAEAVSGKVYFTDHEKRRMIHLAAVFACNFTNHLLTEGKVISEKAGVPFDIFHPLIRETVSKAIESGPENSQTGPAVRNDRNTIEKHMELLSFSPELQKIYRGLTESIINYYDKLSK
jgi:predicted short-subunit dehydrogenase-like oxidoreductase (DUF2520 family)